MRARFRGRSLWIGIRERLVGVITQIWGHEIEADMCVVVGADESEILKLLKSIPK